MKNPQNIIITGASSGIGFALATLYATNNKNLLLIGRNKTRLNKCQKICQQKGANAIVKICDVTNSKKLTEILSDFDQNYPTDLIISNAGISAGTSKAGESLEQLNKIFDTNIYGVTNSIYPLLDKFKQRKKGQIAIISSQASFRGLPSAPAYSASKSCIRFLGEALRGDLLQHNIAVNVICPGYIKTPLTDANNFPMPFLMEANKAAQYMKKKLSQNNPLIIFPKRLHYLIQLTNLLPIKLSDKIFAKLPKK